MPFQIRALEPEPFASLFELPADALARRLATRCTATVKPGFPCRVSLADAEIGDELLLVNFVHQGATSPYRASHAIYVRRGARQARPAVDEVPAMFRSRTLSLRAFDKDAMIVNAGLCEGSAIEQLLAAQFALSRVAYVHIHFAKYGCYGARVDRAGTAPRVVGSATLP